MPPDGSENICPLCNSSACVTDSELQGKAAKQLDESVQLDKLEKHVANHLLRLAFASSEGLDVGLARPPTSSRDAQGGLRQGASSGHPRVLSSMGVIASSLRNQRRDEDAGEEHPKPLESRTQVVEAQIVSKGSLANGLAKQGRHREAESMYREMEEQATKTLGKEHPYTLAAKSNLASMLERKGQYVEAEAMHREILELRCQTLGHSHPETLSSKGKLANALAKQKKFARAEELYRQVLATRIEVLGERHPDTILALGNLADSLQRQGQHEEAYEKYQEAVRLGGKVLGAHHPHVRWSMNGLGEVVRSQAKLEEAEEVSQKMSKVVTR